MSYLQAKMEEVDFDYTMSKNTLSNIEKICLEYKERILTDLAANINVSYNELKEQYLVSPKKKIKYHGKPRDQIDENKCMARVWHKVLGPVQCSRSKLNIDNSCNDITDLKPMFCKIHQKNLNYGRIDIPFENNKE